MTGQSPAHHLQENFLFYNQVDFYYTASTTQLLLITNYTIDVQYTYRPVAGWGNAHVEYTTEYYPDLVGTWTSNEYDMDLTVNVLSLEDIGDDDYEITFTCECTDVGEGLSYIQDTPITISLVHNNVNRDKRQVWYWEIFKLIAIDDSGHKISKKFDFEISVGADSEWGAWWNEDKAYGHGIFWNENNVFLVKEE